MNGMIRKHEAEVSRKAGMLALGVHALLLGAMVISINWKAAHPPMSVTEVMLWEQLPNQSQPKPAPKVTPEPKPAPKIEPKPEPKPMVEPPPKPKVEHAPPKVDIALEQKKQEALAKQKKEQALEAKRKQLAEEMRNEELLAEKAEAKNKADALKKLQENLRNDEIKQAQQQTSAASASLVSEFTEKIKAKIRGNVNKTLCAEGNPELRFDIGVLPSGELAGTPRLVKSSGNSACDDAVERAIIASEPLPLPNDASAKAKFRDLRLTFRPND